MDGLSAICQTLIPQPTNVSFFKTLLNVSHKLIQIVWEMNSLLYIHIGKVHISKILKWKAYTVESKTYNIILDPHQSIFSLLCQLILRKHAGMFSSAISRAKKERLEFSDLY